MKIIGEHYGADGVSVVDGIWYVPVVGVLANEIPNFIPVASDPTLIFFVLRDPPGGSSSASLTSGTSIDFSMSIENMHAYDGSLSSHSSYSGGLNGNTKMFFGLGAGTILEGFSAHGTVNNGGGKKQSVSTSRDSSTSYQYSISFDYTFSTSMDPFTAGHASDIIVGGGVDLVVSEAIAGMIALYVTATKSILETLFSNSEHYSDFQWIQNLRMHVQQKCQDVASRTYNNVCPSSIRD